MVKIYLSTELAITTRTTHLSHKFGAFIHISKLIFNIITFYLPITSYQHGKSRYGKLRMTDKTKTE